MTSKFAPIVKFKQEALDKAQRALAQINFEVHAIEESISDQKASLMALVSPTSGDFALYNKHRLFTSKTRELIQHTKQELSRKFQEQNQAQDHLNNVMQEFEKFKYLQAQEEKAYLAKIAKAESVLLDEIAIMGYNRKKEKR